jgi:hypothetical protein
MIKLIFCRRLYKKPVPVNKSNVRVMAHAKVAYTIWLSMGTVSTFFKSKKNVRAYKVRVMGARAKSRVRIAHLIPSSTCISVKNALNGHFRSPKKLGYFWALYRYFYFHLPLLGPK